jgi:NADH:ubiquinone reductase (non-electrogenic)
LFDTKIDDMSQPKRLVILGTGFAAFSLLKRINLKHWTVTVVSPRNHFLFTPLLPSTTVGTLEFRSIIEPVRKFRKGIAFALGSCTEIDLDARALGCINPDNGAEFSVGYDRLIISVGALNNTFNTPGVTEHAMFLKELSDARNIRGRIVSCLESADLPGTSTEERDRLLHFVVVGGGPTGVEFAAELHDLLDEDLSKSYPELRKHVRITLFEAAGTILNSFDGGLRDYTVEHFKRNGIDVRLGSPVREVSDGYLDLKSGERVPTGLVVWSTGYGPTELAKKLPFEKDKFGRIFTDDHLQLPDHPELFALGDCGVVIGSGLPQTAQVAMQQGKYVAKLLNRSAVGKPVPPFEFKNLGMLAYVGEGKALADLPKVKSGWHGLTTYIFWRSAYLTRLVSLKNKILVLFDWAKTWVFGRDLSRF